MSHVLVFPRSSTAPSIEPPVTDHKSSLPATGGRRGEYALADIARPLGLLDRSIRTIIDTLRALAKHDGLPLPRTPRIVRGKPLSGPLAICKGSKWDAGEFDAWIDGRTTPPGGAAAPLPKPVRDIMAGRARALAAA